LLACNINDQIAASPQARTAAQNLITLRAHRVAFSTMDTYAAAIHRFTSFLTGSLSLPIAQVLPPGREGCISTELVELWLGYASSHFKLSTIKVTLSALADWHKSKGAPSLSVSIANPRIKALLQSIRVQQGPTGRPSPKLGLPLDVLRPLISLLVDDLATTKPHMRLLFLRDAAMLTLGFFAMLRRSELIHMRVQDLTLGPSHITVHVLKSKTDQPSHGTDVLLANTAQRSHFNIRAPLQAYMEARSHAPPLAPLFPGWDPESNCLTNTPLQSGEALAKRLKQHLSTLLLRDPLLPINPASYAMHSLRRGGVMAAWETGSDLHRIKSHGRWASDAVQAYLHPTTAVRLSVTQGM
jgi:integrase